MRDYNFFEPLQHRKKIHINVKSPVFLGFIVILLILCTSAALVAENKLVQTQLEAAKEELNAVQASPEYQEAVQLQNSISALMEYDQYASAALERIESGKSILNTGFLRSLSGAIPSTASLKGVNMTSANASLFFQVPDRRSAAELKYDLDRSGLFLQTTLVSVTTEAGGGFLATLNCILKAGEQQ